MATLLLVAYQMAGPRVTIFVAASLIYLALFGFLANRHGLVVSASIICVVVGLPLDIWVGKSKLGQALITPIPDVMQTVLSFICLLLPMVRLTALGIRQVPESTKEAALAFGANPKQLLTKVELPRALPSIMTGINQVVMMSLSMVVIAALIGLAWIRAMAPPTSTPISGCPIVRPSGTNLSMAPSPLATTSPISARRRCMCRPTWRIGSSPSRT